MAQQRSSLRTFYTLIITQVFSLIGSQMTGLAVGIWVYKETDNATPLAVAAFFSSIARVAAPSVAGVVADRWDRRRVMVLADSGQAVGTLLLLISFLSGDFQLWHLYMVSFVSAVFGSFQDPAFQAATTMLVPDEHRDRANAIRQMTGPAAGIVAPALAGLLFSVMDATGVMIIDLFTFAVAMIVVWLSDIPRPKESAEGFLAKGSFWKETRVGFAYLLKRRPLFYLVCSVTLVNFFFTGVGVMFTPYILSLTDSEQTLGLLMSVMSAGAITGGVIMSVWGGTRPRIHTTLPGIMFTAVFLMLYGVMRTPVTLGITMFLIMFPLPMINAAFMSIMQIKTPADLQGRVFSAVMQVSMFFMPLGNLLAGPLIDDVFEPAVGTQYWYIVEPLVGSQAGSGMGLMAIICGAMMLLNTVIFYTIPNVRHMEAILPDYVAESSGVAEPDAVPGQDDEFETLTPAPVS